MYLNQFECFQAWFRTRVLETFWNEQCALSYMFLIQISNSRIRSLCNLVNLKTAVKSYFVVTFNCYFLYFVTWTAGKSLYRREKPNSFEIWGFHGGEDDDVDSALTMETVCFSETLASTDESIRRQNPEEEHYQLNSLVSKLCPNS
jgi:hypothetical protein